MRRRKAYALTPDALPHACVVFCTGMMQLYINTVVSNKTHMIIQISLGSVDIKSQKSRVVHGVLLDSDILYSI